MLKLTYSEFGLRLEQIDASLEQWVMQRTILALRISEPLYVQSGNASFLVPTAAVRASLDRSQMTCLPNPISFCYVDRDFYEVNIAGVWLAKNTDVCEGILAAELGDLAESAVYRLWESSQPQVPTYIAD
ncbi:alr0857 family protein [Chamaesiphon sp. VAR_69_metabat_338]|uniref:alr0857 family protein n=1 Tax=Chamaesiphon sp. VAR_69_metabat_338 TaxID=2964704 RepID=UPI00286DF426|nr:alr0857 family protein [Chamaesiphon sp. VAR_69_metabat_338]